MSKAASIGYSRPHGPLGPNPEANASDVDVERHLQSKPNEGSRFHSSQVNDLLQQEDEHSGHSQDVLEQAWAPHGKWILNDRDSI